MSRWLSGRGLLRRWPEAVVALLFVCAIWQMRVDWTHDPTYHYGWLVPLLTLYLVRERRADLPVPGAAPRWSGFGWLVLAAAWPVLWLVREANPDWRLVSLAMAVAAVGAAWLRTAAGGGARWRHSAFAWAFFLVSVPWPSGVEQAVNGTLMPANAAISLEALHWCGVPAERRGHLIELRGGTLGVEEACSGIRSLQATLMMALFLGELNRRSVRRRCGLVLTAVGVALLTNALRTVGLSLLAARSGLPAADEWHDRAGLMALAVNAAVMFAAAGRAPEPMRRASPPMAQPLPAGGAGPAVLAAVMLGSVVLAEWWYGRRERDAAGPLWHIEPPRGAAGFSEIPITGRTAFMLRHDRGWSGRWKTAEGLPVHVYYIEWDPGSTPPGHMNMHTPGGCLSAIGMELVAELEPLHWRRGDLELTVRLLKFDDRGTPMHLAYLVWSEWRNGDRDPDVIFDFSYRRRLRSVLTGRRNPGQRMLEAGWWGDQTEAEARARITAFLDGAVAAPGAADKGDASGLRMSP